MTNKQAALVSGALMMAGGSIGTSLGLHASAANSPFASGGEVLGFVVAIAGAILGIGALVLMRRGDRQ